MCLNSVGIMVVGSSARKVQVCRGCGDIKITIDIHRRTATYNQIIERVISCVIVIQIYNIARALDYRISGTPRAVEV